MRFSDTGPGRWGLRKIILLSLLPIFLLAAGAGAFFNYKSAEKSVAHLIGDYIQQRRMELKFIANLPTLYYDQAVQVLTELEKLCFGFKGIVLDMEHKFFRQVIRGSKPFDQAAFETEFEEELAKLLESHQRSLKLLK